MRISTDGIPRALAHHEKRPSNMTRDTTSLNENPEAELVRDARNGNGEAMAELFRRHYPHSIAVARRMLPAQEEFLDAVQSAYLSAFQKFQSFRGEASFKTWITRIVLNQCIMRLREPYRRRITLGLDEPVPGGTLPIIAVDSRTPEDLALRAEIESAVADAVAKLPTALRDVFTRCTVFGLPIRDTAEALGLTVQATKTRLFRARLQLRQELQKAFGGDLTLATSRIGFRS
jgi:RNA polymerase sigma-70 factor, ECF subfamily